MIFKNKTCSIVTRCMNRNEHLAQTLPTWLALPEVDKIIIVDWSSKTPITCEDPRVEIVRVDGEKYFERSRAWNVGISHTDTDYVFLCDCDILIKKSPFELIQLDAPHLFYACLQIREGAYGSVIVTREMLERIKFDETIKYYGYEDSNFFLRLQNAGYRKRQCLSPAVLCHLHHDNEMRYREQPEKRVYQTDTAFVRTLPSVRMEQLR